MYRKCEDAVNEDVGLMVKRELVISVMDVRKISSRILSVDQYFVESDDDFYLCL